MHCSFCSGFAVQPASECCMTMMMMFATSAPGICGLWKHPCADSNPPQGCARIQNLLICNSLTSLFLYMIYTSCCLCNVSMIRYDMMMLRTVNKNRSRVSCAHNTSRASIGIITHDLDEKGWQPTRSEYCEGVEQISDKIARCRPTGCKTFAGIRERNLYLMCSLSLSQFRDLRMGVMCEYSKIYKVQWFGQRSEFTSLFITTARAREFWICWSRLGW